MPPKSGSHLSPEIVHDSDDSTSDNPQPAQSQTSKSKAAKSKKEKKAAKKKETTENEKRAAINNNPAGMLLVSPRDDSWELVIGYFGCSVVDFCKLVNDETIKNIFTTYHQAKKDGFLVTEYTPGQAVRAPSMWKVLEARSNEAAFADVEKVLRTNSLNLKHKKYPNPDGGRPKSGNFSHLYTIVCMNHLMTRFAEITDFWQHTTKHDTIKWHGHAPDDWNRALKFLQYVPRGFKQGKYKTHLVEGEIDWSSFPVPETMAVKPLEVTYLTNDEQEDGGMVVEDHPVNAVARVLQAVYAKDNIYFTDHAYDNQEHMTQLVEGLKASHQGEQNADNQEDQDADDQAEQNAAAKAAAAANDNLAENITNAPRDRPGMTDRPPLTKETTIALLTTLRDMGQARVTHDPPFRGGESLEHGLDALGNQADDGQEGALEEEDVEENGPALDKKEAAEFYELRAKMTEVSAPIPKYLDAVKNLGWTEANARAKNLKVRRPPIHNDPTPPAESPVELQAIQVVAMSWMRDQEAGPIKGGVLALDCGTGKTITTLATIALDACERVKRHEKGEKVDLRPTLLLVPAPVVEVWYREWATFFRDILTLRIYYGTQKGQDKSRAPLVLDVDKDEARKEILKTFPKDAPQSAFGIVLTSYSTYVSRVKGQTSKREAEQMELSHRADLEATTEPTNANTEEATETDVEITDEMKNRMKAFNPKLQANRYESQCDDNRYVYTCAFEHLFYRLVADEAQFIKNNKSIKHRMAHLTWAPINWFVSATPADNCVADNLGFLSILWNPEWEHPSQPATKSFWKEAFDPATVESTNQEYPEYAVKSLSKALFQLHPDMFVFLWNNDHLHGDTAKTVLTSIHRLVSLRMGTATKIETYDGKVFCLAEKIPHFQTKCVEMTLDDVDQKEYKVNWNILSSDLNKPNMDKGPVSRAQIIAKGLRNAGIHRHLQLMSFNMRLGTIDSRLTRDATRAQVVASWHEYMDDVGATFFHEWSNREPKYLPILDRWTLALYIAHRSPKLLYLAGLILKHCYQDGDKLLIWYDIPIEGWNICALLSTIGIPYHFIGSGTKAEDRAKRVALMDDPGDTVKVAVFSARVLATGVNMQRGCHIAVMMSLAHNINNHVQRVGRIHRYKQEKIQQIYILCLRKSYDQILQGKSCEKMIVQLLGEAYTTAVGVDTEEMRKKLQEEAGAWKVNDYLLEDFIKKYRDHELIQQVDRLLIKSLGLRSSRLHWRELVLKPAEPNADFVKDYVQKNTPIRPTPGQLLQYGDSLSSSPTITNTSPLHQALPIRGQSAEMENILGQELDFREVQGEAAFFESGEQGMAETDQEESDVDMESEADMEDEPMMSGAIGVDDHSTPVTATGTVSSDLGSHDLPTTITQVTTPITEALSTETTEVPESPVPDATNTDDVSADPVTPQPQRKRARDVDDDGEGTDEPRPSKTVKLKVKVPTPPVSKPKKQPVKKTLKNKELDAMTSTAASDRPRRNRAAPKYT